MLTVGPALQTQHFDDLTITPDTCVISLSLTAKDIGVMFQPSPNSTLKKSPRPPFFLYEHTCHIFFNTIPQLSEYRAPVCTQT